jgi:hypothetical protein
MTTVKPNLISFLKRKTSKTVCKTLVEWGWANLSICLHEMILQEKYNFGWGRGGLCIPVLEGRDLKNDKLWNCC